MEKISRRRFLGISTMGIGTSFLVSRMPYPSDYNVRKVSIPLGFQVWTIKDKLVNDFSGTLKMVADLGYQSVEMCSPPGYESSGFGPLIKLKAGEMKKIINDAGLSFPSSHYGWAELQDHLDERIEFAVESGQSQMIVSSFGLPDKSTLSDWQKAADNLNKMGVKSKIAGLQMGFHNHNMEFRKIGETLIYDELMKIFDPNYVKMQFQVAVINEGFRAVDYFKKYPGRFISAHLADWSATEKKQVPVGRGVVNWNEFFDTLKTAGVQNIFVEMAPETFKESADYIHSL
jgi:sugar phosphate isomerase/epimerase